jgi:gamma-glutamylcyclotransferase
MYYFAYGTNINRQQMQECCSGSEPISAATLPNYKLIFVSWSRQWRGGVASIKSARGEKVLGAIYDVTDECLRRLDKYEAGYNRLKVIVFDEDGTALEAQTYIKTGQMEEAAPSKEYLTIIQQGYRDWQMV